MGLYVCCSNLDGLVSCVGCIRLASAVSSDISKICTTDLWNFHQCQIILWNLNQFVAMKVLEMRTYQRKRYYAYRKTMKIVNMSSFPSRCYYCDSKNFGSVDGYERHVVTRHPNLPGYPGPADIKYYRLEKQDMYWEREIKADFKWKQVNYSF